MNEHKMNRLDFINKLDCYKDVHECLNMFMGVYDLIQGYNIENICYEKPTDTNQVTFTLSTTENEELNGLSKYLNRVNDITCYGEKKYSVCSEMISDSLIITIN